MTRATAFMVMARRARFDNSEASNTKLYVRSRFITYGSTKLNTREIFRPLPLAFLEDEVSYPFEPLNLLSIPFAHDATFPCTPLFPLLMRTLLVEPLGPIVDP